MNHVFIVNPISGNGNYKNVIEWIEEYFEKSNETYEILITESVGHAKTLASNYNKNDILYAVGGDGTAHEILNGMSFESQLAVIPSGTGNDFYRMISNSRDLKAMLIATIEGNTTKVDVGLASGIRFLNCLNLGIDARVNKRVNESRNNIFPRKLAYMVYAVVEILQKYAQPITIKTDKETIQTNALLASFMNGKWYGGGFMSGPKADLKDGLLEMSVVSDMPLLKIFSVLPKYFKGTHLNLNVVNYKQIDHAHVSSTSSIVVGLDGEVFESSAMEVSVLPGVLTLRVPRGQNELHL